MRKEILEDLTRMLGIYAPSHHEKPVAKYIRDSGMDYLDYMTIDGANNFIGKKTNGSPRILIDSHIDEISRRKKNINLNPKVAGDIVEGKGVDNRAGNAAMIELMRRLKDYDRASIFYVGSAREELENYVHYKHFEIDPDILKVRKALPEIDFAIVIDVTPIYENDSGIRMGKGVVLPKKSLPENLDERIKDAVKISYELAKDLGINHQTSEYCNYYYDCKKTNAGTYRKLGIPTLLLSIPAMYMHGKKYRNNKTEGVIQEKVDVRDIESTVLLAEKLIKKLYGN